MRIAIHQPQYMPWTGYFHKMARSDLFIFLDDVQFKKNEWQHRNRIRGPNGWQWLSVPTTYRFPQLINEVTCSGGQWREQHLRSIKACYGAAPFFSHYYGRFEDFFASVPDRIDEINVRSVALLAEFIGLGTPTRRSSQADFAGKSTERLINICRHYGADVYLSGAGGRDYLDVDLFRQAGISVEFQEFSAPIYDQHWAATRERFVPGLSALDLIMNSGPGSLPVLMGTA